MRVAVLASGDGTNLQAILQACGSGRIPGAVAAVLSDRPGAGALQRARSAGVAARTLRPGDFPSREAHDAAMAEACRQAGADLVVLAGYMRIVGPQFLRRWAGRCINVHPALLPAFPGLHAPAQALAYGVRVTGCTVHFVDAGVDSGPIILQEAVPVLPGDTPESLHRRIQAVEWRLLPEAIALFGSGGLRIEGRRVVLVQRAAGGPAGAAAAPAGPAPSPKEASTPCPER